jgi:hypothetical protein
VMRAENSYWCLRQKLYENLVTALIDSFISLSQGSNVSLSVVCLLLTALVKISGCMAWILSGQYAVGTIYIACTYRSKDPQARHFEYKIAEESNPRSITVL